MILITVMMPVCIYRIDLILVYNPIDRLYGLHRIHDTLVFESKVYQFYAENICGILHLNLPIL